MKENKRLTSSAALLLINALVDTFPKAIIVESGGVKGCFYCDVIFNHAVDDAIIPVIEERLRSLVSSKARIESISMAPASARHYFRDKRQPLLARKIEEYDSAVIDMVRIGDFLALVSGPFVEHAGDVAAMKLVSVTEEIKDKQKVTRVNGVVADDRRALKQAVKNNARARENDHRVLGVQRNLFEQDTKSDAWLWRPHGQKIRKKFVTWLERSLEHRGFKEVCALSEKYYQPFSRGMEHALLCAADRANNESFPLRYYEHFRCKSSPDCSMLWGIFSAPIQTVDEENIFCKEEQVYEELISSLQFMYETGKILEFTRGFSLVLPTRGYRGSLRRGKKYEELLISALESLGYAYDVSEDDMQFEHGPAVIMYVEDAYGRSWNMSRLGVDIVIPQRVALQCKDDESGVIMISMSILGSIESMIALLVEEHGGSIPPRLLEV